MLRLKDSTGVNWCEELPDDPANPGRGLEVMSPVDYSIHVLVGSRMKISLSPSVMLLHDRSLGSEGKSPLDSRKAMQLFRIRLPTSRGFSLETSPLFSLRVRSLSSSLDKSMAS